MDNIRTLTWTKYLLSNCGCEVTRFAITQVGNGYFVASHKRRQGGQMTNSNTKKVDKLLTLRNVCTHSTSATLTELCPDRLYSNYVRNKSCPASTARPVNLAAFHPRPQIASELGRNLTRSSNLHRNRKQVLAGTKFLGLWAANSNRSGPQPAAV